MIRRVCVRICVLLVAATLVLAGCGQSPVEQRPPTDPAQAAPAAPVAATPQPAVPAETTPKQGGILRVGHYSEAGVLDPHLGNIHTQFIAQHVYNTLVEVDDDLKIQPKLAESWQVSADGLTYAFKLRAGVKFHNGRELVAKDVQYSLERVRDLNGPYAGLYRLIESVDVLDDQQLNVVLSQPFAPMLAYLGFSAASVVPQETVDKHGDLRQVMDGTGPFRFEEYVPEQVIRLRRNSEYWEPGLPYLDGIEYRRMADDTARLTALRTGEVDLIMRVPAQDIDRVKADPQIVVTGGPVTGYQFFAFNNSTQPFDNVKVRQAINHVIDRQVVVDIAAHGQGGVAIPTGPVPPFMPSHVADAAYKPDLNRAKQLLAEAGYPDGFQTTIIVPTVGALQTAAAQVVQSQLRQVGIDLQIEPVEVTTFRSRLAQGDFDTLIVGTPAPAADADAFLYNEFHSSGPNNRWKFSDQVTDELLDKGRAAQDADQRVQIYKDAQARIAEMAPMVFLFYVADFEGHAAYVKGYYHRPDISMLPLNKVWLDN